MTVPIAIALYAALDSVSIDKEAWNSGYDTFWASLQQEKTLAEAVHDMLDAAATDQELWRVGKKKFWQTLKGKSNIATPIVGVAKKTTAAAKAAATKISTKRKKETE